MASAANANKKEVLRNGNAANQLFRRERSFVVQRPSQPGGTNPLQQRERSFIRNGSRPINNGSNGSGNSSTGSTPYHNFNSANKSNQARAQQLNGAPRANKPNMEIYRPPSLRGGEVAAAGNMNGANGSGSRGQQLHNTKEDTSSSSSSAGVTSHQPRLIKSRTSLEMHSNSARGMKAAHQQQDQTAPPRPLLTSPSGRIAMDHGLSYQSALQRSKSNGGPGGLPIQKTNSAEKPTAAAVVAAATKNVDLPDLSHFPEHTQNLLRKIATDPDGAASRLVMEAVRNIFSRLIESSRYASPIARYCSYVIEKETKETFLESLLNTCQESFQERDRLLRSAGSSQSWVAFINFLNEMYLQLKRMSCGSKGRLGWSRPPELILLALLAESCCVTLREPSSQTLQELECLFFVLTGIGRDVENELPGKMVSIFSSIRDAFLDMNSLTGAAQRTLLQLIELRAAKWQLPATAVTYYYPASVSNSAF